MTRRELIERHEGIEVAIVMLGWMVIGVVVIQEMRCGFCSF